jgi:hypothetical protein
MLLLERGLIKLEKKILLFMVLMILLFQMITMKIILHKEVFGRMIQKEKGEFDYIIIIIIIIFILLLF